MNAKIPDPVRRSSIRGARGFSLLELIIAMVITAILASIAIPAYNSYILKSHRTEAKSALLDLASMEERYFSTQNQYSQTPTDLGYTGAAFPVVVGSGWYQVDIPNATFVPATPPTALAPAGTPASYSLVATPVAGSVQVNDTACTSFTLTSSGIQTATGTDPNPNVDCWQ
jgi:type IV pilus assembly protein PilE